jgi:trigger factor
MEVAPEFTLPEYTGIPLQRNVEPVKEEEVDRLVQSVLEQFATYEEVSDRPVAQGDMAEISFEGVCEGKPISELGEEVSGLDARQDFWVRVDENAFLPEFEAGLIGKEVGTKTEIAVDFAEDFSVKALAGKKATYFVDIKGIRERKMPEMNEEMLKMLQVDSEAAFRERVRADFKKRKESQADGKLRDDLAAHLLDAVQMDVPQTALQRESSQILRDMIRDNSQRGVPEAEMMENRDKLFEAASSSA